MDMTRDVKLSINRESTGTIEVDGTDLGDLVRGVEYRSYVGSSGPPTLSLYLTPELVEIEGESLTSLQGIPLGQLQLLRSLVDAELERRQEEES